MRSSLVLIGAVLIALQSGCGPSTSGGSKGSGGIEDYERVDERKTRGQENWVFAHTLRSLNSSEHFILESVFLREQGSLTLHSHFNGHNDRDGVRLRFTRVSGAGASPSSEAASSGEDSHSHGWHSHDSGPAAKSSSGEAKLTLEISTPDLAPRTVELPADWVTADGRLKFRAEIHNATPSGARVLIWKYSLSPQGEFETPRRFLSAANADFDSQKEGFVFTTKGRGVKWGLELDQVRIVRAYREAPYAP